MAKFVLKNAYVSVNGVDLSGRGRNVTVTTERPEVDATTFGATAQEFLAGIQDATFEVEYAQDFAAASVDATHWPLTSSDVPFTVGIRPVNAARSATNPEFQISALLFNYSPLAGGIGELTSTTVTYRNSSPTGVQRLVA